MYWIVFALFISVETFADVLLAFWFPFYYELKICTLIWLLAPATNGNSAFTAPANCGNLSHIYYLSGASHYGNSLIMLNQAPGTNENISLIHHWRNGNSFIWRQPLTVALLSCFILRLQLTIILHLCIIWRLLLTVFLCLCFI